MQNIIQSVIEHRSHLIFLADIQYNKTYQFSSHSGQFEYIIKSG